MTTSVPWRHRHTDVACDLEGVDRTVRARAWRDLRLTWGLRAEALVEGARLYLRPGSGPAVRVLVEREARCCGFLDFELVEGGASVRLDITSPVPEGARVAVELAGAGGGSGTGPPAAGSPERAVGGGRRGRPGPDRT